MVRVVDTTSADRRIEELVDALGRARDAARALAGDEPLGVRAVEAAPGRRDYLVAFAGPSFLCVDGGLRPADDLRRAREAASASLLWEQVESLVDAAALRALAAAVGRLLALGEDPEGILPILETVAARALELAAWREVPLRALASVPDLDEAVRLHGRLSGAYARFVRTSEPLVAAQDTLSGSLLEGLQALERAAGEAGAAERLADRLAAALPGCEELAGEMLASHLSPLRP